MIYWTSQIFGAIGMSFILDTKRYRRRTRAFGGVAALMITIFVTHIWGYFYQMCVAMSYALPPKIEVSFSVHSQYTRQTVPLQNIDIFDKRYIGRIFLYIGFGLLDAMWQTTTYWLMGAISNDAGKLAIMVGFCELSFFFVSLHCVTYGFFRQIHPVCRSSRCLAY